jgi:hypothetical protein
MAGKRERKKRTKPLDWLFEAPYELNLAGQFDEEKLAKIGSDVVNTFDVDVKARSEWDKRSDSALKFAKQAIESKNFPWPGCSNVCHPLITTAAIQFGARAFPEIVKGNRVVKCQITGDDPTIKPVAERTPPQGPMGPSPQQLQVGPQGSQQQMAGLQGPVGPQSSPVEVVLSPIQGPVKEKRARADRIVCYSYDTDVLTASGWKPIWKVVPGEHVYSRSNTGVANWYPVTNTVSYHSDDMVHVSGRSLDLLVTRNHNILLEKKGKSGCFFKRADYFLSRKGTNSWYIPLTSVYGNDTYVDNQYGISAKAYLRFLGWYISEGSFTNSGSFILAQSKTANPKKYDRMVSDVEACGFTWTENSVGITVHARSMPNELISELKKLCKCNDKYVPRHVMFYPVEYILEFLTTLFAGDGSISPDEFMHYSTVSRRLADDVQELWQLVGSKASISVKDQSNNIGDFIDGRIVNSRQTLYTVIVNKGDKAVMPYLKWNVVPYDNTVFCIEVSPHHTLYVRRNGKAAWCGNCHMNYQLTQEMPEWGQDMDRLLHIVPVLGQCYKKVYHNDLYDRHDAELVLPADCYVNAKARSVASARRITHRLWLYDNDVWERMESGQWLDVNLGLPPSLDGDPDSPHEFLEQHRFEDLDGDGYKEPYIVTVHKDSCKVVRIFARWDVDGVKTEVRKNAVMLKRIEPDNYFVHYFFLPNPDGSINYLGFGQLLEPINAAVNASLNQLIDSGTQYNAGGGFLGRGVKMRGGTFSFRPGEWKFLDAVGGALRENMVPLPIKEPSAVLFQLLGFLVQAGRDITSVQDILSGDATLAANMPVGTAMALVEQGLKVFTGIYKRIYMSLTDELKKLYVLNARYTDDEVSFVLAGHPEMFIGRSDYVEGDLLVTPVADPDLASDMQRMLKTQALKENTGRPGINEIELTRRLVKAIQPEDTEDILLTDGQLSGKEPMSWKPQPGAQEIVAQAKAQRMGQQAQEAQIRLTMDAHKFQLEIELLVAEIAKKKADAILALARADGEISDTAGDPFRVQLEAFKTDVDTLERGVKLSAEIMKAQMAQQVGGQTVAQPQQSSVGSTDVM